MSKLRLRIFSNIFSANSQNLKILNLVQIAFLICILSNIFLDNFILSQGREFMAVRSIDDYSLQLSLVQTQENLINSEWKEYFSRFDYAYGNIFWTSSSILLMPFYLFGSVQANIVAARELSLLYMIGVLFIIGALLYRIDSKRTLFIYPILLCIATMPMFTVVATKFHVNAPSIFYGILGYFLLVRGNTNSYRTIIVSGIFGGIAVGMKLTSVIFFPICLFLLFFKNYRALKIGLFVLIYVVSMVLCISPLIFSYPYASNEINLVINTFNVFANMGTIDQKLSIEVIIKTFRYYVAPILLLFTFILSCGLFRPLDANNKNFLFINIIYCIVVVAVVFVLVPKGDVYLATYFSAIAFFIPIGLLGIRGFKFTNKYPLAGLFALYLMVFVGFLDNAEFKNFYFQSYRWNFKEIASDSRLQSKIEASNKIKEIIGPLEEDRATIILQDWTTIFPYTPFNKGVQVTAIYNLSETPPVKPYDYILLDNFEYYNKGHDLVAEKLRMQLIQNHEIWNYRYKVLYNDESIGIILFGLIN